MICSSFDCAVNGSRGNGAGEKERRRKKKRNNEGKGRKGDRSRDRERERNRKHVRQRGRGELYTDRHGEMELLRDEESLHGQERWRDERGSEYNQNCMGCTRRDVKILQTGNRVFRGLSIQKQLWSCTGHAKREGENIAWESSMWSCLGK